MLRQGPISLTLHGLLEYPVAVLFVAAPWLFGFHDVDDATAVSIVVGIAVLLLAACTKWRPSLVKVVPIPMHFVLDLGLGVFLIASSFLFGFDGDSAPRIFTIVMGIAELLVVVATRWRRSDEATGQAGYA